MPGAGARRRPEGAARGTSSVLPAAVSRRSLREVPPLALRLLFVPLYGRPRHSKRAANILDTQTAFVYTPRAAANSCSRCSVVTILVHSFSKCQIITELVCKVLCLCVYSVLMGSVARP